MNAFFKTLFGDPATIAVVAVVMATEVTLVDFHQPALAALVVPVLVMAGVAWLARN